MQMNDVVCALDLVLEVIYIGASKGHTVGQVSFQLAQDIKKHACGKLLLKFNIYEKKIG